jgi:cobalamin biosynthetic protein CobC
MTVMMPPTAPGPFAHGGDLGAARAQFPGAPEPFIDLSTGINPHPYPIPTLAPEVFARLPEPSAIDHLCGIAASVYGAPSAAHVVAAPGTQILLPLVAALALPGRAAILSPTFSEHARVARLAGHGVTEVAELAQLSEADLAIVTNPNNPDGRLADPSALLTIAEALRPRRGLLMVDEAFIDASPGASLAGEVGRGNIVVLRSLGKFFGLAGVRLGFALAAPQIAARLNARLGPWAVSGPAIAIGAAALGDAPWARETREALARQALRLDEILTRTGFAVVGGTSLFRLVQTPAAADVFDRLGRAGILVRRFEAQPAWLRVGLPANEDAWTRLGTALRL